MEALVVLALVVIAVLVGLAVIALSAVRRDSTIEGRTRIELHAIRHRLDVGLVKAQIIEDAARLRRDLDRELDELDA